MFFAIAQIVGAVGPAAVRGTDRQRHQPTGLAIGYVVGGGIMIIGGLVEVFLGIDAEGKPLEQVARPLTEVGPDNTYSGATHATSKRRGYGEER